MEAEHAQHARIAPLPAAPEPPRGAKYHRFIAIGLDGARHEIRREAPDACPLFERPEPAYAHLHDFIRAELSPASESEAPPHVELMRRLELVDYCPVSEKGHLKWYPKGVLLRRLLLDRAAELALDWGAFEMANPVLIRGDHNAVGELMGEFHERDYRVDGGRGVGYLRYASDPLAFPFLQGVRFSHKQSPLRCYEEASCFRNERQGEVSGLKRVRAFTMTDMHAACASEVQARDEFVDLCGRFAAVMRDLVGDRWVLGWEGTEAFFEEHAAWLIQIGVELGVPAFFKLMPEMSHYFAMKNEFQALMAGGGAIQVSTVQWDVKDGPRFDIAYTDAEGQRRPCPVILHASSFGSIERALCALLERAALDQRQGRAPSLPFWLAPNQLRIVPVAARHEAAALALARAARARGLRADVDDRDAGVSRRIRDAERQWAPYVVVLGDAELEGPLAARVRGEGRVSLEREALWARLEAAQGDLPRRALMLPVRLSQRPIFFGGAA